jgi:DNA-directed RNA polymerase specialized sigma24 family protein
VNPQDLSEAELSTRCSIRPPDEEAWQELYRRYHRLIEWQVSRILSKEQHHDVADLSAEIVEKVYGQISKYDAARGRLISFILTLARNHVLDFQRRVKNERDHTAALDPDSWGELPSPVVSLGGLDLETAITRYVVFRLGSDDTKVSIFRKFADGKNAYRIAGELGLANKVVYRTKDELLSLVKEFLDSFIARSEK